MRVLTRSVLLFSALILFTFITSTPQPIPASAALDAEALSYYNLPLLLWPVDDQYRAISTYPDDVWTWEYLGLAPGMGCPQYRERDYAASMAYWRTPDLPEDQDWAQASQGHRKLACYDDHAGTDIITLAGAPVYAVADGVIELIEAGQDAEGENGRVEIIHQREFRGQIYTWRGRYLHLKNVFPVTGGFVRAGQLIGFISFRGTNTHLHFEIENLWPDCAEGCVTNPWGPDVLWIDYDDNARIDPAASQLAPAPQIQNLLDNPSFSEEAQHAVPLLAGWGPSAGLTWRIQSGVLFASRAPDSAGVAMLQQVIPNMVEPGSPLQLTLDIGNTSAATKYIGLSVRGPQSWVGSVGCVFAIPPSSPLQTYTVRGAFPERWRNLIVQIAITPADGLPDVMLDNAGLILQPISSGQGEALECLPPGG